MFKDRLNKAIENKGITPYKLSKESGVTQATISNYRKKDIKPSTLIVEQLAKVLEVTSEWLLTGKESEVDSKSPISNIQTGNINTNFQGSFNDVHTSIGSPSESNDLKKENTRLKKEITSLKNEVGVYKDEVERLRLEVERLKSELLNEKERLIKSLLKE